jgi:hypothetical protein
MQELHRFLNNYRHDIGSSSQNYKFDCAWDGLQLQIQNYSFHKTRGYHNRTKTDNTSVSKILV